MRFTLITLCSFLLCACARAGQVGVNTPQTSGRSYPPAIEASPERLSLAQEAWKKFLAEFRLPDAQVDLEPVLNTPRALPMELAGQIVLHTKPGAFGEMEAKEALRRFLERAGDLLTGGEKNNQLSLKDLSLVSFSNDGNFYRAVYQQMNYQRPVANGYGELRLTVGKNGMLLQMNSRLIPVFDLPAPADLNRQSIVDKMVGREFKYSNIAGQTLSYKVTQASEVSVKDLVIYPKEEGRRITIHLAYAVEVGTGTTWTVYVDAVNGQEIAVKQNFVS
jgi:hypothetical protein